MQQSGRTSSFVPVASVDDVPRGWVLTVQIRGRPLALANCDGAFYALDDTCSHAGGPLGDNRLQADCIVECPWHGSRFDVRTGEVQGGPARKAQATYPVQVRGRTVYVAVDERIKAERDNVA